MLAAEMLVAWELFVLRVRAVDLLEGLVSLPVAGPGRMANCDDER
jgi:hypothetical protein